MNSPRPAIFLAICLVVATARPAYGGGLVRPNVVGTRATGLSGAYTAVAEDSSAVFHNPAGLLTLRNADALVSLEIIFLYQRFRPPGWPVEKTDSVPQVAPTATVGGRIRVGANSHMAFGFGLFNSMGGSVKYPQRPISDVREAMACVYPPEQTFDPKATYAGAHGCTVGWTRSTQREGDFSEHGVNFPYRCGEDIPGVCYARTTIVSPESRNADLLLGCDWWANAWMNGQLVMGTRKADEIANDGAQFCAWKPRVARVRLNQGTNVLLIKCHPGSCANWFTCRVSDPGDLVIDPEM